MLELYLKHRGLIFSKAIKLARQFNLELDDVVAQGNLLFCLCHNKFKAYNNAAFTTYFHSNMIQLYNYCKNESRKVSHEFELLDFHEDPFDPFYEINFEDFMTSELSGEAFLIVDWMLNVNFEGEKVTKQKIKKYFKKEYGWSQLKTERHFNQISQILNEWSK